MLTYSFSETSKISLYEQLYHYIKDDILCGALNCGDKLPSKRSFAKHLNISTITIENAYAQLLAEGYLYSIPKRGYYVSDITELTVFAPAVSRKTPEPFSRHAEDCGLSNSCGASSPYDVSANTSVLQQNPSAPPVFADFISNQTCADQFPFATWARLMRQVIAEKSTELMTNPPSGGILELRQAIAGHLQQFRGMEVRPEQIIVGAGTEYLYGLLIQLFGHDKIYGVENPGYMKIARIYEMSRVQTRYISMGSSGIHMRELEESQADIMHLSPAHHFPTGIVTSVSRRREILNWASEREGRYIIEDDYDCEFRLMGKPIRSLQSMDKAGRVVYMNTFTKSLSSTIRISYMVLPEELLAQFHARLGFYSATVSNFEQYTLAKFIKEGYFEKHINRMRKYYRNQRDALLSCIKKSPLSSCVTITEKDAGLHFLMHIESDLSEETIRQNALQKGIRLASLSQFYHGEKPVSGAAFIINYSAIQPERLDEAIHLLSQCI